MFIPKTQSRIETPKVSKTNSKFSSEEKQSLEPNSLEERVSGFLKTSKYMYKQLDLVRQKIDECDEGSSAIDNLKMTISPDAATLISQGDSLVLETHGKNAVLSEEVVNTQQLLREKFKSIQMACLAKNSSVIDAAVFTKTQNIQPENSYIPRQKSIYEKKFSVPELKSNLSSFDIEEISRGVLKRVTDLIQKPMNLTSEVELTNRIYEIRVSFTKFFFINEINF